MIDVLVEGDFEGSPVLDSLVLEFGHGVPGDDYAHPHVMACCPEYDLSSPNCERGHEQACMADLAEQGCKSIVPNLHDFAEDDEFGGPGLVNAVKRAAIHKIADYVRDHQVDCIEQFITNTGIGPTPPTCDEEDNGVGYDALLEAGAWSFDPPGLVSNVEISVQSASWTSLHPLDGSAEHCQSSGDNDDVLFLEHEPPDPGSKLFLLATGSVALHGPALDGNPVEGYGALGSAATGCQPGRCSSLRVAIDSTRSVAALEGFELYAASAAEVGTSDQSVVVQDFRVLLWDSTPALLDDAGGTLTIPPGHARFAVSAAVDDMRGAITATNASPIVLSQVEHAWSSSGFEILHRDALGQEWVLVIMPIQWQ